MNDITAATIAALATIDAELGMSEDGCNSTARTLTAIRLLHSVHLDDVAEIARLERALKLQRNAALTLADASAAVSGARLEQARKLFAESRPESVESERAMNAILTADVERIEREPREKLAVWMLAHSFATGHGDTLDDLLGELSWQVKERSAEAEALRHDMERQAGTLAELATDNEGLRKEAKRMDYVRKAFLLDDEEALMDLFLAESSAEFNAAIDGVIERYAPAIDAAIAKEQKP